MKHEWKKQEKEWYSMKKTPVLLKVPEQSFIMISGQGNPNDTDFSNRVAVLYSVAYAIKMGYKAASAEGKISGVMDDFSVYPLEGVWKQKEDSELIKEKLEYTIMIRQPDFITEVMIKDAVERVKLKKFSPLLDELKFETMQDGSCVQMLHTGPFDDEPASFEIMDQFVSQQGLKRISTSHREIYLNNAKRTLPNKLQTILRYQVR